jgi:14-3-3 protein epsilon
MKKVAASGIELGRNERVMLATAYKNVIGTKRTAFRLIISSIPDEKIPLFREALLIAKQKLENEIDEVCVDVLQLAQDLLRTVTSAEYRIYLLKLRGDYTRYRCEMRKGQELNNLIEVTHEYYMTATTLANKALPSVNQTRLGLALNFSVFFFEIARDKGRACALARDAYEAG